MKRLDIDNNKINKYSPKHHDLKAFSGMFDGFLNGEFNSTVRNIRDRIFNKEDTVTLHEGHIEKGGYVYTGRKISFRISGISNYGCIEDHVCLHLKDRNLLIIKDENG